MSEAYDILSHAPVEMMVTDAGDIHGRCPVCSSVNQNHWLVAPDHFHGRTQVYELLRCPNCSLVWLKDPPQGEAMQGHYGQGYDQTVADAGDSPERWLWRRDVLLQHKSSGAILDVGCSAGGFLDIMRLSSWRVSGIEMSPTIARRAVQKSGADVCVGDVLSAPFRSESFDVITCFHVLEHVYYPRQVLARIYEWLKPGGVLYLMVPNIDSAGARIFRSYWSGLELPRHLYHFSPKSLCALIQHTGFDVTSMTTQREIFLENSLRYFFEGIVCGTGIQDKPSVRDQNRKTSLLWRIIRKSLRLTALLVGMALTKLAGDGETIHGIFRKPGPSAW